MIYFHKYRNFITYTLINDVKVITCYLKLNIFSIISLVLVLSLGTNDGKLLIVLGLIKVLHVLLAVSGFFSTLN